MTLINKKIILKQRPIGPPKRTDFAIVETPVAELKPGEVLLKTLYFSIDPYMRGRMNVRKSYIDAFQLGEVITSSAICKVEESQDPLLKTGDIVLTFTGWQTHAVLTPKIVEKFTRDASSVMKLPTDVKPSLFLGILGMPGITAYHGLFNIGEPKAGETVVAAAATGPVGSLVGQLAKQKGCHVVGIAGGPNKCQYAVDEFGFDACIDRKSKTFNDDLVKACPKGIDIYFENVGGPVFNAVLPLLNVFARVPVCGVIHWYNDMFTLTEPGFSPTIILHKLTALSHLMRIDQTPKILSSIIIKRLKFQGFISSDIMDNYDQFLNETLPLVKAGKIKYKEDIIKGIENAPEKLSGLLEGKNFGKLVIEV